MSATEIAQLPSLRAPVPHGPPPKRLIISDVKKGWGRPAVLSDEVTIEFAGTDFDSGVERWRSQGNLGPFQFLLGGFGVIRGWESGLKGMRVGGRRELIVPSSLAAGKGARTYAIDMLAVHPQTEIPTVAGAADGPQDPGRPSVFVSSRPPPRTLLVEDLRPGRGQPLGSATAATVKYVGIDYASGYSFFNAWGPNQPSDVSLDDPQSVWARGLKGMRVGGQRRLTIPDGLAYGGGALIYSLELTAIS